MVDVQLRQNQNGGIYDNGRTHPRMFREKVLDLYHDGIGLRQISREVKVSLHYVQKVVERYNEANTSQRHLRREFPTPKISNDTLDYIEIQKLLKPSTYGREIRDRLLLENIL